MLKKIYLFILVLNTFSIYCENYVVSIGSVSKSNTKRALPRILEMYRMVGIEPQIKYSSPERSPSLVNRGVADAEFLRIKGLSGKFSNLIVVDEPVYIVNHVVFSKFPLENVKEWDDLKDIRVAYVRGVKIVENNIDGYNWLGADTLDRAFELYKNGRVDYISAEYNNGIELMKKYGIEDYYISVPLSVIPIFHYVNIKHKQLVPELEKALKEIKSR